MSTASTDVHWFENLVQESVCFLNRYTLAVLIADALSCSNLSAAERICSLSLPDDMVRLNLSDPFPHPCLPERVLFLLT